MHPGPHLGEKNRPAQLQGNQQGQDNQKRGEDEQPKQGSGYVEEAFGHWLLAIGYWTLVIKDELMSGLVDVRMWG